MRHLREILNLTSLLFLLGTVFSFFYFLQDWTHGTGINLYDAAYGLAFAAPYLTLLGVGWALGVAFYVELAFGTSSKGQRSFPREKSLAREGKGKDAALGLLFRDKIWGDRDALWAVLEMARYDDDLGGEAVQAASRIIQSRRSSQADRDHAGRSLQLAKVSEAKAVYTGWR
jgi:hypothetical protein